MKSRVKRKCRKPFYIPFLFFSEASYLYMQSAFIGLETSRIYIVHEISTNLLFGGFERISGCV